MKKLLFTAVLAFATVFAWAVQPVQRKVYMFGFAASFTDSTAYITDIQAIDSAYVHENGFLADRTLYAVQMDGFLQHTCQEKNMTCVVFFHKTKAKLEKKYLKIRKKYTQDHSVNLIVLEKDRFRFHAEEWVESEIKEVEQPVAPVEERPKGGRPEGGRPDGPRPDGPNGKGFDQR